MVCTGSIYGRTPIRLSVRLFHYSAVARRCCGFAAVGPAGRR